MKPVGSIAGAVLAGCALLAGCSGQPSESGGGFEGEAVTLSGEVRFGGARLAGASVSFRDLRTSDCLARATTDTAGKFRMAVPAVPGRIEVRSADTALFRGFALAGADSNLRLEATRPVPWRGRLVLRGTPVANATIRPLGSSTEVATSADGRFALPRTGLGREWVRILMPDGTDRDVALPAMTDSVVDAPDHRVILLDDFEGEGTRSALGEAIGSGWWFANDDSAMGGGSRILPAGAKADLRAGYSALEAFAGTSLSLQFSVDPSRTIHFAQVGLLLSDTSSGWWMDLSGMDSITFQATGSGSLHLYFATRTGMEPDMDPQGFFGTEIPLSSSWTRVVVHASDIAAPSGSRPSLRGIPWSEDSRHCLSILFWSGSSATFRLDDIELHGPRLPTLLAR